MRTAPANKHAACTPPHSFLGARGTALYAAGAIGAPPLRSQLPCRLPPPGQAPHKVNLGSPQKTILVSVLKSTCGVAVVDRFREL